jgi:hypothetical protein
MNDINLVRGQPYFLLVYHDEDMRFPEITSLVYLGKDVELEDGVTDRWSFQDAESYALHGDFRIAETPDAEIKVYDLKDDSLREVLSGEGLVAALQQWLADQLRARNKPSS